LCGALSPPQPNWTAQGRRSAPGCPRSILFRPRRNTSKSAFGRRLSISRSPITKRYVSLNEQATEKRGDRGLNPSSTEFSRQEGVKSANGPPPPPMGDAGPRYQSFQALSGHGSFCARRFCTLFAHWVPTRNQEAFEPYRRQPRPTGRRPTIPPDPPGRLMLKSPAPPAGLFFLCGE
jgi:hypothetical protein